MTGNSLYQKKHLSPAGFSLDQGMAAWPVALLHCWRLRQRARRAASRAGGARAALREGQEALLGTEGQAGANSFHGFSLGRGL